jgi:hypothetical protein
MNSERTLTPTHRAQSAKSNPRVAMNRRTFENARSLFWPWCLMTCAGLLPLMKAPSTDTKSGLAELFAVFGFFGGAAVLTALSFRPSPRTPQAGSLPGEESNPGETWSEKMNVLLVGIVCAGVIVCFVQSAFGVLVWKHLRAHNVIEPVLLLVIIVCSTGFWTLLTRSIIGGIILTGLAQLLLYWLLVLFVTTIDRLASTTQSPIRLSHDPEVHSALMWFVAAFALIYAAVTLRLGRRKFMRMHSLSSIACAIDSSSSS